MFVGIGNGIDGLVHMSEVSWSRRKKTVTDTYKKGSMVDALVINIDKGQKKFSLSIKQLNEDPWSDITEHYHVGDIVEGYITSLTDFGIFIEIENGIEGLIHISEVDEAKGKHPSELFNIDDKVRAMVLNIDARNKRIGLSMKAIRKVEEDRTIETYTRDEGALSTLGDFFERSAKRNDAENT